MRPNKSDVGKEVVFIYNEGTMAPCHAVLKDVNGPWSKNRVGFCGCEPHSGPMSWCSIPDEVCRTCASYIEKRDNKHYVKDNFTPQPYYHYLPSRSYDEED